MIKTWGDYLRATKTASEYADTMMFKTREEITIGSELYNEWLAIYDSKMEELYG